MKDICFNNYYVCSTYQRMGVIVIISWVFGKGFLTQVQKRCYAYYTYMTDGEHAIR